MGRVCRARSAVKYADLSTIDLSLAPFKKSSLPFLMGSSQNSENKAR